MNISGNFSIKEITRNKTDQIDGNSTTQGRKKGVKVTGKYVGQMDFEREPSCVSAYHGPETPMSISPPVQRPRSSPAQQQECPKEKDNEAGGNCNRERGQGVVDANISKQTVEELKSLLQESSFLSVQGKEGGRPGSAYSYLQMTRPDGRPEEVRNLSFTTFKPQNEGSQNTPRSWKGPTSLPTTTDTDPAGACRSDVSANSPSSFRKPIIECATWKDVMMSQAENGKDMNIDPQRSQTFSNYYLTTGHIKQKIAQEEVNLVRFEAADLHGVSRSKTVPAHVFQEKALYGVPMPRSYLELTLSPKNTEVDHGSASNFNSDVLLIPELPTFRVLPWASQTARVICDSCSVSGHPLRTSPRLIAKQLLGQLQSLGFSLHSSFSYECCVFSVPEKINSNALFFPAATLLNNHDLPFFQQMVSNMYYMGVEVDSFSSASRPGQMEISLQPEFGISAADSAFTLRTGIKEMARKHGYIASFFADDGFYNSGVLSHSLWDVNGRKNLFHSGGGELSETGRKWLAGLLHHSASLNCMMAPGVSCRRQISKDIKDPKQTIYATCGFNDNSCAFNVKSHGGKGMHIDNKMGSAMANPYLVLATTVAAGLDGIKRNLTIDIGPTGTLTQPKQFPIPVKLEDALIALEEDHIIRGALGDSFVHYFMAMKRYEIETQEMDAERNKCLEYFI